MATCGRESDARSFSNALAPKMTETAAIATRLVNILRMGFVWGTVLLIINDYTFILKTR